MERHDRDRLDAVRELVNVSDRLKKAEERLKPLEPLPAAVERVLVALPHMVKTHPVVAALAAFMRKPVETGKKK